ncbi:glycerol-3-phosphate dehydrogenase [Methylocystis bryophila]|uniref:Glycerol-3-phosphate dehydrogenase n=1 Tax=Methylocystis bryophila TaxID=655015 RepID=A0A1W6MRJ3_9HYPH|nr:glycerol-3-phosphate dehydrogenase [Methylocystis bryophila]ARN80213.1 glycerol-3-phosphate dehydrogenase [Methylocystis bryophila]BDV40167.1 glycerol-3-phosphate dehydrogenase [Methylocystis bryophila]
MFDLLIVGGGINGCAIARDAAGRGLSVRLVEKGDLASCTSSASTKLIHGGLRYLEHFEFRLVREALAEREVMLASAPHLVSPLTFVLPHEPQLRPAWMIRLGLFLYDHLAPRGRLDASRGVSLKDNPFGAPLDARFAQGFTYADCWVDDARLVVANALSARDLGALISPGVALVSAERRADRWIARLETPQGPEEVEARALVNAAGPYVSEVLHDALRIVSRKHVRLVKGSHLVTRRLYEGAHAYILQNVDRRIVFAIPYEGEFTLIGSTDAPHDGPPGPVSISDAETDYLLDAVSRCFKRKVTREDIVSSYAGLRPLFDDGSFDASVVTRDYAFDLDREGAPALSVFGGKITTARKLAEHALETLKPSYARMGPSWTGNTPLAGGESLQGEIEPLQARLLREKPFLPQPLASRLAHAYGARVFSLLSDAARLEDLGEDFGCGLTRRELDYLMTNEWARTAEDVLWRRSKLGLHMSASQCEGVARAMEKGFFGADGP